jgi:diguanylate cyclase (GGDEF)-like protein/PAS domain S-box-containing protein
MATTPTPHNNYSPPCGDSECSAIHNDLNEALENALKSDSLFRIISDNAPIMIWMTDDCGKSIFFNKSWLMFTGRAYEQELGDGWMEGVHPDDRSVLRDAAGKCLEAHTPCRTEYRLRSADGTYRWIMNSSAPYVTSTGLFCGFISTCLDITESKEAEFRLRESETALKTVFNSVNDAIFLHDVDGRIIDVNDRMLELYRVTKEEALSMTIEGHFSGTDNDISLLPVAWRKVLEGETMLFEWKARRPHDGSEFEVEAFLRKIVLTGKDTIIANIRDISGRKKMERDLMLAAKVFDNSIEGISITDTRGIIEMINPAFTEITGYGAEEAIGRNPRILKSRHHTPEFYKEMWDSLKQSGHWSGEIWNRRKNGEAYPEWLNISAIYDNSGAPTHYVGIFHDITEIKRNQEAIQYQAHHDALTGLPNRTLFQDRLLMALNHAQRHQQKLAVLFLDLDNFKNVNDSLGHACGDLLLKEIADRLTQTVREEDSIARLGGDEFTVILAETDTLEVEEVARIAQRIIDEINLPILLQEHELFVGASIGISIYPDDGSEPDVLTKCADMAMYRAKEHGRNNFQFFTPGLETKALQRMSLETEFRKALDQNELVVHYQPKVSLASGAISGFEALVRWKRQDGSMVAPSDFIPLAEETGLIVPLGEFVLDTACAQLRQWIDNGRDGLTMAVNISARQFWFNELPETTLSVVERHGVAPGSIELELTESLLMHNVDKAIATLGHLKQMGFRLALDDFGTGYSSLYYLKRFPIDSLKIDRSFVMDIPDDSDDMAIAESIISLARTMKLAVTAEGVETHAQLAFLKQAGCDDFQGYLFSPARSAADIGKMLARGTVIDVDR